MDNAKKSILILLAILVTLGGILFYILSDLSKDNEKNTNALKQELRKEKNKVAKQDEVIKRMEKDNVDYEYQLIMDRSKEFVKLLYQTSPDMNDKERKRNAELLADEKLVEKFFGNERKNPVIYDTKIKDLKVYTEPYSPSKKEYRIMITLLQQVKGTDKKVIDERKVASELKLKQKESTKGWYVDSFEQFDEQEREYD
ncbi:hypothetical protein BHX94_12240 (plasmid) [Macrococcoides bohemicum]|uniref:MerR family transcriptional regulator n=1 Tax=Macrococcoides bohemicum TaxID=1903056 RepID=A0A328A004_9STAP|nr:hypothetical protein [Macrococcus bohemicus]RAK47845.1 hypothetical protein BHX94_12240 [Macrococcus bohemicus]